MQETIVSDTSCLIIFEKISELDLLRKVFGSIIITQTVAEEFGLPLLDWISIQNPSNQNYQKLLAEKVDIGEASAIALALELQNCLLIIDDQKGRNLAKELGIKITGTLGVVVEAKVSGIIDSIVPILAKIRQTDFHLSEDLETIVLGLAGEIDN